MEDAADRHSDVGGESGAHALFAWRMSDGLGTGQAKADAGAGIDVTIIGMEWPVTRILPIAVASCAVVAAMIVVSFRLRIRWTGTLTVCVAVAVHRQYDGNRVGHHCLA